MSKLSMKPLLYFCSIWLVFLILRFLPIIKWHELHLNSILYLYTILIIIIISYLGTILLMQHFKVSNKSYQYTRKIVLKNFKKIFFFLLFFSVLSIMLIFIKFYTQLNIFNLNMSLSAITDLRYERMHQSLENRSLVGIVGTMLSGFSVILYLLTYWYKERVSKIYFKIAIIMIFLYSLAMLTSGGRNALFIVILILLVTVFYKNIYYKIKSKFKVKKYLKYSILVGLVLYVFYIIFTDRDALYGYSFNDRIKETAYWYKIDYNSFIISLLDVDYINGIVFLFLSLYFYLAHSLDQFDIAFNSTQGINFPYLGALDFYPIVQLLNKFGLDIVTVSQINHELPNPGNYTTLFAPLYFDFGVFGSILFISFITCIFVFNYLKFLKKGLINNFLIIIILSLVYIVSPIYSFFGLGIASPIFLAFFVFMILNSFMKIEKNYM